MREPGEIALKAVFEMRWERKFVVLARVNDEFCFEAEAFQSLVHLLSPEDGDIRINVASHEESRGGDLCNVSERRDVFPDSGRYPGETQFSFVVPLILVMAIHADDFSDAGA
jgi:hypothetical protein